MNHTFSSAYPSQKRAIAYYRSATNSPDSLHAQKDRVRTFARLYGIDLLHEEEDRGRSGLLQYFPGLTRLFSNWILNKEAPLFDFILLDDVSRWGRVDSFVKGHESLCTNNGKHIIYISHVLTSFTPTFL